jgi:HEAT repeat protein
MNSLETEIMTRGFRYFACLALAVLAVVTEAFGQQPADPYKEALHYKFDRPRTAVMVIEAQIGTAKPEQLRTIEGKLIQILQSPEATADAKAWVCRQLRQAGSDRSVAAVAPLLADKELATVARLALQSIPGQKVDDALRAAIGKLQGDLLAGVLQTIGVRGDRQAVTLLAPLANDKDPAVAEAALFALGHIGGADVLRALKEARVPRGLQRALGHAILLCAERMAADGQKAEAAAACQAVYLYSDTKDIVIRTAALRAVALHDEPAGRQLLASAMKSDQRRLRSAAAKILCESCGKDTLTSVLAELPTLPTDAQTMILGTVADKAALPAVLKATKSEDRAIREAALGALARVGDASCVPLLLDFAASGQGPFGVAANQTAKPRQQALPPAKSPYVGAVAVVSVQSLRELRGAGVAEALIAAAQEGKPAERIAAVQALFARGHVEAVPVLLKVAESSDGDLQGNVCLALATLADQRDLPALVDLLVRAKEPWARTHAERAVLGTCLRIEDKNAAASVVANALTNPSIAVRQSVTYVLTRVPSVRSLEALRTAMKDSDSEVSDTAFRGLAAWPDAAAVADLSPIAHSDKSLRRRILALQGVIRLAGPAGKLPAPEALKLLTDAMSLAERPDEKKLALAALGDVKHQAAIDLAAKCLSDPALEVEAATAVVKIAKGLRATNPDAAAAAIQKVLDVCKSPAARQPAESAMIVLGGMINIAPQGKAASPDDLDKDGTAGDDQAGIDGDPATYWDEKDGQKLYRFVVTFKQSEKIAAISLMGYEHHQYAPKDFEVLCDGKSVKKVDNAQYDSNFLLLRLDETTCTSLELKITGYYGQSPAIRELGIYRAKAQK